MFEEFASVKPVEDKPVKAKPVNISLSKSIDAPAQKGFDHWLIPVFVGEWMFGPHIKQEKLIELKNTVRRGGSFSFTVNQQGKVVEHSGSYLELDIPNRLVFNWKSNLYPDCESQISVRFQEENGKTRMKINIRLDAALENFRDEIKQQWAMRCNALAEKFKRRTSTI